ncbi:MAG: DUF72 domain-containing protein, partial [Myxococcales bacterium]|nr:DUF72 domain-containing protein [Myxococcales bacterium]
MGQLDMFGAPERETGRRLGLAPPAPALAALANRLREALPELRLGTSSWSFPGWQGILWDRAATTRVLAKEGLATYARHPLFRTVGLDRTYYGPMSTEQMRELTTDLPADFRILVKAHAECTTVKFPERTWNKSRAGQRNELFLEPEYATQMVVRPFIDGLGAHGGVILFQFPPQHVPGGPRSFAHRVAAFLEALPKGPQYA